RPHENQWCLHVNTLTPSGDSDPSTNLPTDHHGPDGLTVETFDNYISGLFCRNDGRGVERADTFFLLYGILLTPTHPTAS
ncbi:hypothetical protein BgiMline_015733, partial [Biomphalaria glabrata]